MDVIKSAIDSAIL